MSDKELSAPSLPFARLDRLTPISSRQSAHDHTRTPRYLLRFNEGGEPLLSADTAGLPEYAFPTTHQRILRELSRIRKAASPFSFSFGAAEDDGVSLRQHPYLLDLLPRDADITGPGDVKITFDDAYCRVVLVVDVDPDVRQLSPRLQLRAGDTLTDDFTFLTETAVLAADRLCTIPDVGPNFTSVHTILEPVSRDQLEIYLSLFASFFDNISIELNGKEARMSPNPAMAIPTIVLEKVAPDKALYLRLIATVDSLSDEAMEHLTLTRLASVDEEEQVTLRDISQPDLDSYEESLRKIIHTSAPSRQARKDIFNEERFFIIPAETASPFLLNHLANVLQEFRLIGSERLKEYKVTPASPKLNLKLSSGIDFLEGSADVEIGSDRFSIADLLKQYSKNRYVLLSDGNRAIIDSKYISRLQRIFHARRKDGKIKVSFFDLPEVEQLIEGKIKGDFAARSRKIYEGFNKLSRAKMPPVKVEARLRDYQKQGVKWLDYLRQNNLGGCLADDMGLGKTLQTISLLSLVYPGSERPSLIVMPRSLLFNWEKECAKFAPGLRVATYYGSDRDMRVIGEADLVLTTYAMVRNDVERLKDIEFEYVILDESQNIKNVSSQTAQAVTLLTARHRLALSGTPMENNLTELYSLFRFLNPTMFGTFDDFNSRYTYPIQKGGDKDAAEALRRKIFPFVLRRLKRDVLKELPERIDRTLYVEMSPEQRRFYNERRLAYKMEIEQTISKSGVAKSQFVMFQALNELRRIASVPESLTDGRIASPKIEELVENLSNTVGNNHKCVVFFNYIAGLDIVAERLNALGIQFETMTGSTTAAARKRIVERFQSDPECMVLLMTLKVGGVGLNLTAADTVFIVEPWWNKAAEEQAINRLHRIGQKASVVSTSFITEGTIEEKIRQLQQQKSELFDALISDDSSMGKHLSEEDINFILS